MLTPMTQRDWVTYAVLIEKGRRIDRLKERQRNRESGRKSERANERER